MKVLVILSFAILVAPGSSQWFSRHPHRNHHGRRGPPRMHGLRPPPMPFPPPSLTPPLSMDSNSSGGHIMGNPQPPMSVYSITTEESIYPPIGIDDGGNGGTTGTSATTTTATTPTTTTTTPMPTTTTTLQPETPSTTTVKDENAVFSDHMIDILRKLGELTAKEGASGNGTKADVNPPAGMNSTAAATVVNMADTMKFGNVPPPAIEYQSPRRPLIPMMRSRNPQMKPRPPPPPMWKKNYRGIFSWKRQPNQKPQQPAQQNPIRRFDYNVPEDDRNRQAPPQMQPQQPQMPPPRRAMPVPVKSGLMGKLLNLGRGSGDRPPPQPFTSTTTTSTTPRVIISLDIPTGTPSSVSRSIEVGDRPGSLEAEERIGTGGNSNTLSILAKLSPRKPIMVFMRQEGIMETSWAGSDPGKVVKKYAGSTKIQFFNGTIPTDNIPPVFLAPGDMKPPRGYGKIPIPKIEPKTETTTQKSQYLPLEDQIRLLRLHRERLKLRKEQLEAGFYSDPFQSGSDSNTKVLQVDGDQLSPGFYDKIRNSLPRDAIIESIEPLSQKHKPYSHSAGAGHNSNAFYKAGTTSGYPVPGSSDQSSHSSVPYEIELPQGGRKDGLVSNNELQKIVGSLVGGPTEETRVTSPYDIPGLNPPPMLENHPNQRHPGGHNNQPPPTTMKPFPPQGFHQIPSPNLQNPHPSGPQGPPGGPGEPPTEDLFSLNMKLFYHKEKPRQRGPPPHGPHGPSGGPPQQYGQPGGFPPNGPQFNNQNGPYNNQGNNFNNGGYNGPSNGNSYNNGGYNQGTGDSYSNNGGYNSGNGGDSYSNNGGYNQGNGDSYSNNGGYNQGNGDSYSNNGGYNSGNGDSYSNNGGYNSGNGDSYSNNGGYNQGGPNGYNSGNQYQDGSTHNDVVHPPPNGSPLSPTGSSVNHSNRKRPGYSSREHSSYRKENSKYNRGQKNSYEDSYKEEKSSGPTIILHSSKKGSSKAKTKSKSPTIVITGSAGGDMSKVNKIINSLNLGNNDEEDETREERVPYTTTPKPREYSQAGYTQGKAVSPVFVTTAAPTFMIVQNSPSPVPARFIINNNTATYMEDQSIPKFSFDDLFPQQQQQQQQQFIIQAQPIQQPPTFFFQQTPQLFPQVIQQQQSQAQVLYQVNSLPAPTLPPAQQVQNNHNNNAIVVPNASPESPLPPVIFVPNHAQQEQRSPQPSALPPIVVTPGSNYAPGPAHTFNFQQQGHQQGANYFPGPTPAPAVVSADVFEQEIQKQHEAAVAHVRQAHHRHSPQHRQPDVDLKEGIFPNPSSQYEIAYPPPERSEYFVASADLGGPSPQHAYQKDSQFEVEPIPTVSIDMNVQSYAKLKPAGFKNAAGEQVVEKVKTEEKIVWERRPEAGGMVPIKVTTLEKSYVLPNGKTEVESSVIDSHIAEDFVGQQPMESFEFFKRDGTPTHQTAYAGTKPLLNLPKDPTQGPEPPSVSPFVGLLKSQAHLEKLKQEHGPGPIRTQFQDFRSTVFG